MKEEYIKITVQELKAEAASYGDFNPDGLCILFADNISFMLNEENIEHYILTISQYVDTNYYHEFIIAFTEDKKFLIDPTFGQFINNGTNLIKFLAWPGDVLKTKENGEKFTEELLNQGLYEVTESDVKSYLSSFDITKQNEDIDFSFQKLRKVNNK